jgi:hypothetical protein
MIDFVYLPHFQIPLAYEAGAYVYRNANTTITALECSHGWQLSLASKDGSSTAIVVEGETIEAAESALVDGINRSTEIATAALMQASVEARHSTEARAA